MTNKNSRRGYFAFPTISLIKNIILGTQNKKEFYIFIFYERIIFIKLLLIMFIVKSNSNFFS